MRHFLEILVGIILGVAVVLGAFFGIEYVEGDGYSGTLLLEEQEYIELKYELAREDVKINELTVVGSSSPYLVSFSIRAKEDFSFGKTGGSGVVVASCISVSSFFALMFLAINLFGKKKK